MIKMSKHSATITILDHHKTAKDALKNLKKDLYCPATVVFDMKRAGCQIAWDHFNSEENRPLVLDNVGDRDLWEFKIEDTKEISAAVFLYEQIFENWDYLMDAKHYGNLRYMGGALLKKQNKDVKAIYDTCLQHKDILSDGILYMKIPVINASFIHASDLGHHMLVEEPDAQFSLIYYRREEGDWSLSFRSKDDRQDVSEIAKEFGGGGHRNSSGCVVDSLPWE